MDKDITILVLSRFRNFSRLYKFLETLFSNSKSSVSSLIRVHLHIYRIVKGLIGLEYKGLVGDDKTRKAYV